MHKLDITCQITDPNFPIHFTSDKKYKNIEELKDKVRYELYIRLDQFEILNLPNLSELYKSKKHTFDIKIKKRYKDLTFHLPNDHHIFIKDCYKKKIDDIIPLFNDHNIHLKKGVRFSISGHHLSDFDYPFYSVFPDNEKDEIEIRRSRCIVLDFGPHEFIFGSQTKAGEAKKFIYKFFTDLKDFYESNIHIQKKESKKEPKYLKNLKCEKEYCVHSEYKFVFQHNSEHEYKTTQIMDLFAKVSDAQKRLASIFSDSNELKPENILIYNSNKIADNNMFLIDIQNEDENIFYKINKKEEINNLQVNQNDEIDDPQTAKKKKRSNKKRIKSNNEADAKKKTAKTIKKPKKKQKKTSKKSLQDNQKSELIDEKSIEKSNDDSDSENQQDKNAEINKKVIQQNENHSAKQDSDNNSKIKDKKIENKPTEPKQKKKSDSTIVRDQELKEEKDIPKNSKQEQNQKLNSEKSITNGGNKSDEENQEPESNKNILKSQKSESKSEKLKKKSKSDSDNSDSLDEEDVQLSNQSNQEQKQKLDSRTIVSNENKELKEDDKEESESEGSVKIEFIFDENNKKHIQSFTKKVNINTTIEELDEEISDIYDIDTKILIQHKFKNNKMTIDRDMTIEDVLEDIKEGNSNILYIKITENPKSKQKSPSKPNKSSASNETKPEEKISKSKLETGESEDEKPNKLSKIDNKKTKKNDDDDYISKIELNQLSRTEINTKSKGKKDKTSVPIKQQIANTSCDSDSNKTSNIPKEKKSPIKKPIHAIRPKVKPLNSSSNKIIESNLENYQFEYKETPIKIKLDPESYLHDNEEEIKNNFGIDSKENITFIIYKEGKKDEKLDETDKRKMKTLIKCKIQIIDDEESTPPIEKVKTTNENDDDDDDDENEEEEKVVKPKQKSANEKYKYYYQTNNDDEVKEIELEEGTNVKQFKEIIGKENDVENLADIKIIFAGKDLLNDIILDELNIGDTILFIYIRTIQDILLMTAKALQFKIEEEEEEEEKE